MSRRAIIRAGASANRAAIAALRLRASRQFDSDQADRDRSLLGPSYPNLLVACLQGAHTGPEGKIALRPLHS
jgi:hypothetical protein